MSKQIATHNDGDKLFFDGYDRKGFARGFVVAVNGDRIEVPSIASLVYRGYGWTLNKEGRRLKMVPNNV